MQSESSEQHNTPDPKAKDERPAHDMRVCRAPGPHALGCRCASRACGPGRAMPAAAHSVATDGVSARLSGRSGYDAAPETC